MRNIIGLIEISIQNIFMTPAVENLSIRFTLALA